MSDQEVYRAHTPGGVLERADRDAFFKAVFEWLAAHTDADRLVVERVVDGRTVIKFSLIGAATWAALFEAPPVGRPAAEKSAEGGGRPLNDTG